jgi:RNA polymerase sigma-B factor
MHHHEVVLPSTIASLPVARSMARGVARHAGVCERRIGGVCVATGELVLRSVIAVAETGQLTLSASATRRRVRVSGRARGVVHDLAAMDDVQRTLLDALTDRFEFSVDGESAAFELEVATGERRAPLSRDDEVELFTEYQDDRDPALRNQLVDCFRPIAIHVAQRYRHKGEPTEDLVQVASIGLVKAVERFDPDRGLRFATYATATIDGEIKRYFRDSTWTMKVARDVQELHLQLRREVGERAQVLGRAPSTAELASHFAVPEQSVREALRAGESRTPLTIDAGDDGVSARGLGTEEHGMRHVEDRLVVRQLMARLPERDRRILHLRYFEERSQADIAAQVGVSQMHVSRLLVQIVGQLRARARVPMEHVPPAPAA